MQIVQNTPTPSRKVSGGGNHKLKPQPSQEHSKPVSLSINPQTSNSSANAAAPLFGSADKVPVGEEGCFTKILNSRCCLAIAGLITAGILLIRQKFSRTPSIPPAASSPKGLRPSSPSLQSTQPPTPQHMEENDDRSFLSQAEKEQAAHIPNSVRETVVAEAIVLPQLPASQAVASHDRALSPVVHHRSPNAVSVQDEEAPPSPDEWIVVGDDKDKLE